MKKEKRYEIIKRGQLDDRDPRGINAIGADEDGYHDVLSDATEVPDAPDVLPDVLPGRTRRPSPAPRSTLNNVFYNNAGKKGKK